ncbi:AAA domain [Trypanosoma vivax]|nr:hypothetical protein TRVL_03057 [Trypanosoma vivax]KAH8613888.1 AAA domain [Trypanosoma vivax]
MGGGLSRQEKLFIRLQWRELLEEAMNADAALSSPSAAEKGSSGAFRMTFQEWQALITLLSDNMMNDVPSRLCAGLSETQIMSPFVVLMVHTCCWFDGRISEKTLAEQLARLNEYAETELQCGQKRIPIDKRSELELTSFTASVLIGLVQCEDKSVASYNGVTCKHEEDVKQLFAWDTSKRPVVMLAHAFVVGVVACIYPEPHLAIMAVSSFRLLQEAMNGAASSHNSWRVIAHEKAASTCNITKWYIARQLESALLCRQRELDVSGLVESAETRWWLPVHSDRRSAGSSESGTPPRMTPEQRWAAMRSQYVGQQHVWSQLTSHFLSSDVLNTEKPTVIVLFGPSGFGKSEMAKRIACAIHGGSPSTAEADGHLVHIHLPSFCTRDSIYSLVDPPAAHVGEGLLLSALRRKADAVVVLDEFEKGAAEAVQNLWLSAFQKHGTLRSLKDTSRSVSTERVTFVLTCNIAADIIRRDEQRYLNAATEDERASMRMEWTEACKATCRRKFHDPFVNRVDYFVPFVPYTSEEKRRFVRLQLCRIVSDQRLRGRRMYITPRMVDALADQQETFHATTIEGVVRPLLVEIKENKWDRAVLTVEECFSGQVFRTIPVNVADEGEVTPWSSFPGGQRSVAAWDAQEGVEGQEKGKSSVLVAESKESSAKRGIERQGHDTVTGSADDRDIIRSPLHVISSSTGRSKEYNMELETELVRTLQLQLTEAKELLLLKDKEIAYLKEKVLLMEKIVAVLLAVVLSLVLVLAMFIGFKLAFVTAFILLTILWFLGGLSMKFISSAMRALYDALGPVNASLAAIGVSLWASIVIRNGVTC